MSDPVKHARIHNNVLDVNHSTMPLVLAFLKDRDALCNFLPCHRAHKYLMRNYTIKSAVDVSQINALKYTNYRISNVKDIDRIEQLKHLPLSVHKIEFGLYFNQPVQVGVIPQAVTHLTFGRWFNPPLQVDVIPPSVTHLTLGRETNP